MTEVSEIYNKKKFSSTFLSMIFLVFILILFAGLFLYNSIIEKENIEKEKTIQEKEVSIKILKSNPIVQVANLYDVNKSTIERMDKYSEIVKYINHLNLISNKYGMKIKGFSYSSGELKSNLYSIDSNDRKVLAYEKLAKFIKEYREDEKALFDLKFISRIDNNIEDKEKIALNLSLK